MSRSKLLTKLPLFLIWAALRSSSGQEAKIPARGTVVSPEPRLQTDSDRVIRDFVLLLNPKWDNGAWDLVISGKRSMNPNFGVLAWDFAVLNGGMHTIDGFSPSAVPCSTPRECFSYPDVANAKLVGRIYQRGSRVYAYVGAPPDIAKKNEEFQKDFEGRSYEELEERLTARGADYPPSKKNELQKSLVSTTLFTHYSFHMSSLRFCRIVGTADAARPAFFWSAIASSAKSGPYRLIVEPFNGNITGFFSINKGSDIDPSCNQ